MASVPKIDSLSSRMFIIRDFIDEFYNKTIFSTNGNPGANLTPSLIKSLFAFRNPDHDYPIGELGKNAGVKKSTITDMVDRLEQERIAKRIHDTQDRRIVKVRLTNKGKKTREEFIKKSGHAINNVFSKLDKQETHNLLHHLEEAYKILKEIK